MDEMISDYIVFCVFWNDTNFLYSKIMNFYTEWKLYAGLVIWIEINHNK